jgi:hypothetical protein
MQTTHSCNRASYHERAGYITRGTQSTWLGNFVLRKEGNPALLGQRRLSDAQYIADNGKVWPMLGRCLRHLDLICENRTSQNIT